MAKYVSGLTLINKYLVVNKYLSGGPVITTV